MKFFSALETNAAAYELVQRLVSLDYRVIRRALREEGFFAPGKSYLDLGCGTGYFRDHLKTEDYLGIDLNPTYIEAARRKRGNCFQVGNALNLDTVARRFDRILCVGLFHHLDDAQTRAALAQVSSRLNRDGETYIIDALWPEGFNPIGAALRRSDNGAYVRELPAWKELFESALNVRVIRRLSQWPFDYVFVRASARPAG